MRRIFLAKFFASTKHANCTREREKKNSPRQTLRVLTNFFCVKTKPAQFRAQRTQSRVVFIRSLTRRAFVRSFTFCLCEFCSTKFSAHIFLALFFALVTLASSNERRQFLASSNFSRLIEKELLLLCLLLV